MGGQESHQWALGGSGRGGVCCLLRTLKSVWQESGIMATADWASLLLYESFMRIRPATSKWKVTTSVRRSGSCACCSVWSPRWSSWGPGAQPRSWVRLRDALCMLMTGPFQSGSTRDRSLFGTNKCWIPLQVRAGALQHCTLMYSIFLHMKYVLHLLVFFPPTLRQRGFVWQIMALFHSRPSVGGFAHSSTDLLMSNKWCGSSLQSPHDQQFLHLSLCTAAPRTGLLSMFCFSEHFQPTALIRGAESVLNPCGCWGPFHLAYHEIKHAFPSFPLLQHAPLLAYSSTDELNEACWFYDSCMIV